MTIAFDRVLYRRLLHEVTLSCQHNHELIMIDESTFSSWSYQRQAWAPKGMNVSAQGNWRRETPISVCAAVSQKRGLICYLMEPVGHTATTFIDFLAQLNPLIEDKKKTLLLLDNCSIHTAWRVQNYLIEQQLQTVQNVPYQPQFNGIELYWAQCKKVFRQLNTQVMTRQSQYKPLNELIEQSLNAVPKHVVSACCQHSVEEILRDTRFRN